MGKGKLGAVVVAMALGWGVAMPASANPVGPGAATAAKVAAGQVETVHFRRWRHCHRRYGRRWCHGRRYYSPYYYGPGISLYFGPRFGHHRHFRHRHFRHRHFGHRGFRHRGHRGGRRR